MSRQQSHMLRGNSHQERAKTKPKKVVNENDHKNESNSFQLFETYNRKIQQIEKITQSLFSKNKRTNRENDMGALEQVVKQLVNIKRFATQHSQKINSGKNKMEHGLIKKEQKTRKIQHLQIYQSLSPQINKKGLIACEQSPKQSLIERKIAQDENNRTSFQSIKKRDYQLSKIFQQIDRIADKLNVFKGERYPIPFRKMMSSIQASIQGLMKNEEIMKSAFRDIEKQQSEMSRMKNQIELLNLQNLKLQSQLKMVKFDLKQELIALQQKQAQCESLNKECELIAKEKLDIETLLSQEYKRHRDFRKILQKKTRKVKDCLKEGKWLQSQLKKAVKEHRNNIQCFSREAFNELICAYTQELFNSSAKRKREVAALEAQMAKMEQSYETAAKRRNEEYEKLEYERRERLRLVSMDGQYLQLHAQKANKEFSILQIQNIIYTGKNKNTIFVQTQYKKHQKLDLQYIVFEVNIQPARKKLQICSENLSFIKNTRFSSEKAIQTDAENIKTTNDSQVQTIDCQKMVCQTQTEIDQIHTSIQTFQKQFTFVQSFDITISPQIVQTFDAFTNTTINLDIVGTINENYSQLKQTAENSTNTEHDVSIYHEECETIEAQFESSAKKMEPYTQDSILSLLLEAEECTVVPQICLLRQQITVYRSQIQRLNKIVHSQKSEREREDETVFQFCY